MISERKDVLSNGTGVFRTKQPSTMQLFFAKTVNDLQPLTIFAKKLHHRFSAGL